MEKPSIEGRVGGDGGAKTSLINLALRYTLTDIIGMLWIAVNIHMRAHPSNPEHPTI